MTLDGKALQSLININKPNQVLLPNINAMLTALLFSQKPKSVLNIGMGGGAFERALSSNFPALEMTAVESSQSVIHSAKEFFSVPESTTIYNTSGEEYLSSTEDSFDIILCDIFSKESHPDCLYDSQFYAHLSRALNTAGVLALNLSPNTEAELLKLLLPIRIHFPWVSLLTLPDCSNIILFICRNQPPDSTTLQQRANQLKKNTTLDLDELATQVQLLPQKE